MDLNDTTLLKLAAMLTHQPLDPPGFLVEELIAGLGSERLRLGQRPFVVTLLQNDFDVDGLTSNVFLLESFDTQANAMRFTDSRALQLLEVQISGPDSRKNEWKIDSFGKMYPLPEPKPHNMLRTVYDSTYKIWANELDRIYNCFRVIGYLTEEVVSDRLFDFLNCDMELWHYFVAVGESIRSGKSLPTPAPHF
jgi:hypothetical protein